MWRQTIGFLTSLTLPNTSPNSNMLPNTSPITNTLPNTSWTISASNLAICFYVIHTCWVIMKLREQVGKLYMSQNNRHLNILTYCAGDESCWGNRKAVEEIGKPFRKIGKPLRKTGKPFRKIGKPFRKIGKPLKILRPVSPMGLVACVSMDLV